VPGLLGAISKGRRGGDSRGGAAPPKPERGREIRCFLAVTGKRREGASSRAAALEREGVPCAGRHGDRLLLCLLGLQAAGGVENQQGAARHGDREECLLAVLGDERRRGELLQGSSAMDKEGRHWGRAPWLWRCSAAAEMELAPAGRSRGEKGGQPWRCSAREKKGRAGHGAEASLGENVGLLKPGQRHGAPKKKNRKEGARGEVPCCRAPWTERELDSLRAGCCAVKKKRQGSCGGWNFFEGWECKTAKGKGEGSVFIEKP
jgi:hypothetical protein